MNVAFNKEWTLKKGSYVKITKVSDKQVVVETMDNVEIGKMDLKLFGEIFTYRTHYHAKVTDQELSVVLYAPLHGHSGYSLLDGASQIEDMVEKAELHMAITDHGNMFGALDFYKKMKKAGKQPIIGCELYSENIHGEKNRHHLLVLAETVEGYKNLSKLVSKAYENFYHKPQVSYDMLREHSEGLIVSSACMSGEVPKAVLRGDEKEARVVIETMIDIFGKDNYVIEIQRHGIDGEKEMNETLVKLAKEYDLKVIATADSHYTNLDDRESQEILLCIGTKAKMEDEDRMKFDGGGYHIHSSEEMARLFSDMPEALVNTLDLAERIQMEIPLGELYMPHFDIPKPFKSDDEYFVHLCREGFKERFKGTEMYHNPEYHERMKFEMDTINSMGFPAYFLITWDVIKFAKDNGILVGPGRGSACGSLVAYVLQITDIDPIEYDLLFERFLNPDRISMPDIDTDFPDDRRDEVIEYVKKKYGEPCVARIVTFTRLTAKAGVKDVSRVLGYAPAFANKLSKAIPATPGMTFEKAFAESGEFKELYENNEDVRKVVDHAIKLEKMPRNTGVHACGVVISSSPITDYMPQFLQKDGATGEMVVTTQFNKDEVEEAGLLKMDFLGLRTMGVVSHALEDINKKREGKGQSELTLSNIPMFDVDAFKHISKGHTAGVFQLESGGMTSFMKQLFQDVDQFEDDQGRELFERLVAGISLYRPGPIDEIPNYIANMVDQDNIVYDAKQVQDILKNTYGIIVYQEQCMQIVRDLAGFSRGQSDTIRKGMAKKLDDLLNEYGVAFIEGSKEKNIKGCIANGITEKEATVIWDKMLKFSKYAFNKSHAVGYSYISSKTAYLATHYPVEYLSATLNSFINNSEQIKRYMTVARRQNINVLPPNINRSMENFSVDGSSIRFGLKGIRAVGMTSERIMEERNANQEFTSFKEFLMRMLRHSKINKSVVESLIYAGALDDFDGTRKEKLLVMEEMLAFAKMLRESEEADVYNIFDLIDLKDDVLAEVRVGNEGEMEKELLLQREREFAGFYITEHPIAQYEEDLKKAKRSEVADIVDFVEDYKDTRGVTEYNSRKKQNIAGVITSLNQYFTKKNNDPLYVFTVEDETGEMNCVAFSDVIKRNESLFVEGQIVYISGAVQSDEQETQMVVNTITDIHELQQHMIPSSIVLKGSSQVERARRQFQDARNLGKKLALDVYKDGVEVKFIQGDKTFSVGYSVPNSVGVQMQLSDIVGKENVFVEYA